MAVVASTEQNIQEDGLVLWGKAVSYVHKEICWNTKWICVQWELHTTIPTIHVFTLCYHLYTYDHHLHFSCLISIDITQIMQLGFKHTTRELLSINIPARRYQQRRGQGSQVEMW